MYHRAMTGRSQARVRARGYSDAKALECFAVVCPWEELEADLARRAISTC